MRTARRALVAMAFSLAGSAANAATSTAAAQVTDSPSWASSGPSQAFGFSAPTVTQSGVTYAPADPSNAAAGDSVSAAPLADLPAWDARPPESPADKDDLLTGLGLRHFGSLPEPAIWALLITGFAIVGGALRGLIVVNRRLQRLRAEDDQDDG